MEEQNLPGNPPESPTATVVAPVVSFLYNGSALHNEFGQMVGAGFNGLWIQDPAGVSGNSVTGVQGVQVAGYDRFNGYNLEVDGISGAAFMWGGYQGNAAGSPDRESWLILPKIRNSGNWASGQSTVIEANPDVQYNTVGDIGYCGLQIGYPDGVAVDITSYYPGDFSALSGPNLTWFSCPNGQIEKGNVNPAGGGKNYANINGPGPLIEIQMAGDIYFKDQILNGSGSYAPLFLINYANTVTVDNSRVTSSGPGPTVFTVGLTNGSPTVTLQAGYTNPFDTTGKWNGVPVELVDGTTCTTGSPCLYWLSTTSAVGSATTATLDRNYAGTTNTSTATLTIGNISGPYFGLTGVISNPLSYNFSAQGNEWSDPYAVSYAAWGTTQGGNVATTNWLLAGIPWVTPIEYTIPNYDGYLYTDIAANTGPINASAFETVGTKFTTSGCSVSSTTGGATAGKFTLGANTCTVVITMNGATGYTANNGFSCTHNDETTAAANATLYETTSNTTTASLSIPATAGSTDVIDFACTPF